MGGAVPDGYIDFVMCTELYHCTPEELSRQDADVVSRHFFMYQEKLKVENRVKRDQEARQKARSKSGK